MRYIPLLLFIILSCSTKKDILFIQDVTSDEQYNFVYKDIIIKNDDILKIQVSSFSSEVTDLFSPKTVVNSSTLESFQLLGYQVNKNGDINLPVLGYVKVEGLTISQITKKIEELLVNEGILLNPSIDVKIVNAYFTILGEVNKPGRYSFIKNDMDILQAIGIAGDLTINGVRDNIKIMRRNDSNYEISNVDLTKSNFINSDYFQIMPGDIIIVNPNSSRVKNAGVIGNAGNLLSLLSFLLSSIILISSN